MQLSAAVSDKDTLTAGLQAGQAGRPGLVVSQSVAVAA